MSKICGYGLSLLCAIRSEIIYPIVLPSTTPFLFHYLLYTSLYFMFIRDGLFSLDLQISLFYLSRTLLHRRRVDRQSDVSP